MVKVREDKNGDKLCITLSMHGKCDAGDQCWFSHLGEKNGAVLTKKEKAALTQRKASMSRPPSKGRGKGKEKGKGGGRDPSRDPKGKGKTKNKTKDKSKKGGDDRPKCGNCGKPGHTAGECRSGPTANTGNSSAAVSPG